MPGFFICNNANANRIHDYDDSRCLYGKIVYNNWTIQWNTLNKFLSDKIFQEFEGNIIVFDGIVYNIKEIQDREGTSNWAETILKLANKDECFFKQLRGCFAGAIYYKKTNRWITFTDQVSNHSVFVYCTKSAIAIGTRINYFSEWMRDNGIRREIDHRWVQDMFYYGYVIDTHSIIQGVNRVYPGSYVIINALNHEKAEKAYFNIKKKEGQLSDDEWIEKLEIAFQQAVDRISQKCSEYNYTLVTDISGGLDSRMIAAHLRQGKNVGMCFAQSGSDDQTIALQVSNATSIPLIQYFMDGGECLYEIDDIVFLNQGMTYYAAITGGKKMLEILDRESIGIEINGLLGDVYEGAMITEDHLDELQWRYDRYRQTKRFQETNYDGYDRNYQDNELLWFYARGVFMGQNTVFIRQNYCEAASPYGDVEYLNVLFSIPYKTRTKERLLQRWLIDRYPQLSKIKYAGTGVKVTTSERKEYIMMIPLKIKYKLRKALKLKASKTSSMNPFEYWYSHNDTLKTKLLEYYQNNIHVLNNEEEIKRKVVELYESANSTTTEKLLAISVISAIKQYIYS